MATYEQLQEEIKALQIKAEMIKREEKAQKIAKVKALINEYDLTPADLGFNVKGRSTGSRPKAEPKYMDPITKKTWNGRGKPPLWIQNKDRALYQIK